MQHAAVLANRCRLSAASRLRPQPHGPRFCSLAGSRLVNFPCDCIVHICVCLVSLPCDSIVRMCVCLISLPCDSIVHMCVCLISLPCDSIVHMCVCLISLPCDSIVHMCVCWGGRVGLLFCFCSPWETIGTDANAGVSPSPSVFTTCTCPSRQNQSG